MPTYAYEAADTTKACEHCRAGFEWVRGMNDPDLETCPQCGVRVRRAWKPPNISAGRWSTKRLLNKDNLHKHGFQTGTDLLESGKMGSD